MRLTCPRCGEQLESASSRGRVTFEDEIRLPVECPNCAAALTINVMPDIPEGVEVVDVWAEDRPRPEASDPGRNR